MSPGQVPEDVQPERGLPVVDGQASGAGLQVALFRDAGRAARGQAVRIASGRVLKYFPGGIPEQLTGFLTQWSPYQPGEAGSEGPFAGHDVPFGYVWIYRHSNDVGVFWKNTSRLLHADCVGTTLGGTDSDGDVWTIDLLPFHI